MGLFSTRECLYATWRCVSTSHLKPQRFLHGDLPGSTATRPTVFNISNKGITLKGRTEQNFLTLPGIDDVQICCPEAIFVLRNQNRKKMSEYCVLSRNSHIGPLTTSLSLRNPYKRGCRLIKKSPG